ncbi:MAG TPA: BREX-1 system phosphatase PglZ type A [Thermodesulfobacteriota bacterium]|nr:BREX-1 system phosphatase PglZ type A [Thermodesulfobacteriota bacterium]
MDIKQVKDSLNKIFKEKDTRIVFWYDTEREFEEVIPSLELDGIGLIRLDETSPLEVKIKLELEDKEGKYIVYSPSPEPDPEEDWLLDIRLYSYTFHADRASLLLNELGLKNQTMRSYLKERHSFFRSQDRLKKLQKWVTPDDTEDDIDLKMLAVLARSDHPDFFSSLMKLFDSFCSDGDFNPHDDSKIWEDIEKHGLVQSFWKIAERTFGHVNDSPAIQDFIIRLIVADLANSLKTNFPSSLKHFLLENESQRLNASVFLSQWRTNLDHYQSYKIISNYYSKELRVEDLIRDLEVDDLLDVMTFEAVEQKIIKDLRDKIVDLNLGIYSDEFKEIIRKRLDGQWAGKVLGVTEGTNLYRSTYQALETAIGLLGLRNKCDPGFSYPSAEAMFRSYTNELYLFDQFYRKFHEYADKVELGGWDILKKLDDAVEDCYNDWFISHLALTWGSFIEKGSERGLIKEWSLPGIKNQYNFYEFYVENVIKTTSRNRIFVIISDGLRYEAAEELTRLINGRYRFRAKIDAMLGVLPSYTGLGMAVLLPHKTLTYKDKNSPEILVDGLPSSTLEQRSKILARVKGTTIKAEDLFSMNKDEGREFVKPHQIIYIYHNKIDAIGDKASSESNTFNAVSETVEYLISLTSFIINSLNGSYVIITADHGFLYMNRTPRSIDKSVLDRQPPETLLSNNRYILGRSLGKSTKVWKGSTKVTSGTDDDMEFWLPKGANRFNFFGGARYFHGGAMLQEIVVPVVTVEEIEGKEAEKTEVRKVGVSLLGTRKKLVTNIHRFEFIQTDPVSERVKPRTLQISIRDGEELISNEETVTFDSISSSMDERKKSVKLILKAGRFDSKKEYYLVLRDAETKIEYDRIPVFIDLAISKEF